MDLPVHPDDEDVHYDVHQDTHVQYVPLTYHGLALRPQMGVQFQKTSRMLNDAVKLRMTPSCPNDTLGRRVALSRVEGRCCTRNTMWHAAISLQDIFLSFLSGH